MSDSYSGSLDAYGPLYCSLFNNLNYGGSKHLNFGSSSKTERKNKTDVQNLETILRCFSFRFSGIETFLKKNFGLHKRVPPLFVSIFCNRMDAKKIPKCTPFTFFIAFFDFLEIFQSLQMVPFSIFIFSNKLEFQKAQRVPFFAHDEVNVHCSPAK